MMCGDGLQAATHGLATYVKLVLPFLFSALIGVQTPVWSNAVELRIDPPMITGAPGETAEVSVWVWGATIADTIIGGQFTIEYDSTLAVFRKATVNPELESLGFFLSVVPEPALKPEYPQTNRMVLVGFFTGVGWFVPHPQQQHVVTLEFTMQQDACGTSPLTFNPTCNPHTHISTWDLRTICFPELQVRSGLLAGSQCATDVGSRAAPVRLQLQQNVPNPFNPSTEIQFGLPSAGTVQLQVFDVLGRRVRTLLNGCLPGGWHATTWNGLDYDGNPVPSGVYYYTLQRNSGAVTRSMLLLK
jgi:hypothetical protein